MAIASDRGRAHPFTTRAKRSYIQAVKDTVLRVIFLVNVPRLSGFDPQGLANTAWAFAVLDHPSEALFCDRFVDCCAQANVCDAAYLFQLHQWQLWREERAAQPQLPPSFRERCAIAFASARGAPSGLQRQVHASLKLLDPRAEEERRSSMGYSIDSVVEWRGVRVAVEVDGPSHFVGLSHTPAGATLLKRRQLQTSWPLCAVPYWEWNALDGAVRSGSGPGLVSASQVPGFLQQVREAYLRQALDAAVERSLLIGSRRPTV